MDRNANAHTAAMAAQFNAITAALERQLARVEFSNFQRRTGRGEDEVGSAGGGAVEDEL